MTDLMELMNQYKDKFTGESWALIYAHDEVVLKKIYALDERNKELTFADIKEARFFNEDHELKVWKYQNSIKYRLFSMKKEWEEYVEKMVLWNKKNNHGRGCDLKLSNAPDKEFVLTVKNYYCFDDNGIIKFEDARLCKIEEV